MWRKAETLDDVLLMMRIAEKSEPHYYATSEESGAAEGSVEFYSNKILTEDIPNEEIQDWIYEDGENLGYFRATKRPNQLCMIERFCACGFSEDVTLRWAMAFDLMAAKLLQVMAEWDVRRFYSITPKTRNGLIQTSFARGYWGENAVTEMPDKLGLKTDISLDDVSAT